MSILSKSSFLSKWATLFATNGVRAITATIQRDFRQDINDSFLNITDQAYDGVKGWKNGINTISGLKSITTAALSTGINIAFRDTANSDALRVYELTAGTDAESSPAIVRPNDYDGTTNQKVWKIAVAGGETFSSDPTVVLPAGKSFGKYVDGDTPAWTGLTAIEAILDAISGTPTTTITADSTTITADQTDITADQT